MNISHTVDLNMSASVLPPVLYMAQYDANSRTIVASLWDGLTEFDIPSDAIIMVRFGKPDGTGGLYDHTEAGKAITYSGNVVMAPVATQMLTVPGRVRADIEIYQTGATAQAAVKLATFCFTVIVERAAYQDAEIISSDSYNFISAQISAALAAVENASSHSPQISDDGYWRLWDASIDGGAYVTTQYPAQGPAGYTPVKGTDYWTAEDKAEIVADVLAALPDGTEVSY